MSELFEAMPITIAAQIVCVEREIRMREHVYPRRVGEGKMSQAKADDELAVMRAVLDTLRRPGEVDFAGLPGQLCMAATCCETNATNGAVTTSVDDLRATAVLFRKAARALRGVEGVALGGEARGTYACPHCGVATPHTHSQAELDARAEVKRYPNLLCQPFGGGDYCYHCGRDMCVGSFGFNTVCPTRKRIEGHAQGGV